jgi:hypothetical protein
MKKLSAFLFILFFVITIFTQPPATPTVDSSGEGKNIAGSLAKVVRQPVTIPN